MTTTVTASMQTAAYWVEYISFGLGTISLLARIYTRVRILNLWGWDDNFAILIGVSAPELQSLVYRD